MRSSCLFASAGLAAIATATTLADLCTVSNVQSALPTNGTLVGINLLPATVTATTVYNASTGAMGSISTSPTSTTYSYCNITVTYARPGKSDVVLLLAFPEPTQYQNRFYVAGGGGYSLATSATGGLQYGSAGAATSAGYDAFSTSADDAVLFGNGSINWDTVYMFGYQALGEMTQVAKAVLPGFYGPSNSTANGTKIYTYYEGCSDGGREGMSQVQRFPEEYDGVITGAPAFRYAQQQVFHVFSSMVEKTLDYYPPPCALDKIVNATIAACDPLDGRTDGVVARTDLCQLNFNLSSIVGESYYCAASSSSSLGFGFSRKTKRQSGSSAAGSTTSNTPAQNGTVNADDVAVAQKIYDGLFNSQGERAYLSWQVASQLGDAATTYDNTTGKWQLSIPSTGGEFVTKFVELLDLDNLSNLEGATYDTLVDWMTTAYNRYLDSLQTTVPDLTAFQSSGGKLLHYHGESDPSVPAASSVHYWQSVREIMYGNVSDAESVSALKDWYQLYLVPGAAHCGSNPLQPDGPYPQDNMATMIDWVENGVAPTALNATVSEGTYSGEVQRLCQWPTRPLWATNDSSTFDCVDDSASAETWTYSFPAFKVPIY